jgi:hypothetical protein
MPKFEDLSGMLSLDTWGRLATSYTLPSNPAEPRRVTTAEGDYDPNWLDH